MRLSWTLLALVSVVGVVSLMNLVGPDAHADGDDTLKVGAKAPSFRLNDQHGKAVSLKGVGKDHWVALAFYPKSATPG